MQIYWGVFSSDSCFKSFKLFMKFILKYFRESFGSNVKWKSFNLIAVFLNDLLSRLSKNFQVFIWPNIADTINVQTLEKKWTAQDT